MTDAFEDPVPSRGWSRRWPIVVIVLALASILAALHSPLVAVETIEIVGAVRADVGERVARAGLGPGALLLHVDTASIEDAVRRDPWVADARVERIWPDTVVVEVIEREPVLWVEGVATWMLVARDGTILETAGAPGGGLLLAAVAFPDRLPGEIPSDLVWGELVEMALVLSDDLGRSLRLELRGPELWTTAFGHEIRLGNPVDLADKARTLRALLADEVPAGFLIDVSSPVRPAVVPPDPQDGVEPDGDGT